MDTRSKILTAAEARQIAGPVALVTSYFDVLRGECVRELEAFAAKAGGGQSQAPRLLAAALPLEGALLEQRARAELVAGLRVVDYVIAASEGEVEELIEALKPLRVARLEAEHIRLSRELRERVHNRLGKQAPAR